MKLNEILKPKSKAEVERDLKNLEPIDRLILLSKIEINKYLDKSLSFDYGKVKQDVFKMKIYDIIEKLNKDSLLIDIREKNSFYKIIIIDKNKSHERFLTIFRPLC